MARLSAGDRLMTRIRRLIMAPPSSGPCRCTAPPAAGGVLLGLHDRDRSRSARGTRGSWRLGGLTASSRVSVAGMVRPSAVLWLAKDGTVLWTSSTWMSAMASSVHGTGSVDEQALEPVETFDVGVDVDPAARLQVAGERVRPGQRDRHRVHAGRQGDGRRARRELGGVDGWPLVTGWVRTSSVRPGERPEVGRRDTTWWGSARWRRGCWTPSPVRSCRPGCCSWRRRPMW